MKKNQTTICSVVIGLISLLTLCTWPTQAQAQDAKKKPEPKDMAGAYVLAQNHGLTIMVLTKGTVFKEGNGDGGVTVIEVVPILNVNLSKVGDVEKGITFMEPDVEKGDVLMKCTTFDVQWSETEQVLNVAGLDSKKKCLYRCQVKAVPKKGKDENSDPPKRINRA